MLVQFVITIARSLDMHLKFDWMIITKLLLSQSILDYRHLVVLHMYSTDTALTLMMDGCIFFHDMKVLIALWMLALHTGHWVKAGAQLKQHARCPHGTNTTETSLSAQILHSFSSRNRLFSCSRFLRSEDMKSSSSSSVPRELYAESLPWLFLNSERLGVTAGDRRASLAFNDY